MKTDFSTPALLSSSTIHHSAVENPMGDGLGKIEELMIDLNSGRIAYAVLSFGGFLGLGDKYFAIPWEAFKVDSESGSLILDVDKEMLLFAPGFDKNHWPDTSEHAWLLDVYDYYGYPPYWK